MEADQIGRLRDILDAARLICAYIADTDEIAFRADTQKQDAIMVRSHEEDHEADSGQHSEDAAGTRDDKLLKREH